MVFPVVGAIVSRIATSVGTKAVANQVGKSVVANTAKSEATGLSMGRSVGQLRQGMDTARQIASTARSVSNTVNSVRQLGQALKPAPSEPQKEYKPNASLEAANRQTFF
jgi:hypothetical protein